MNALLSFRPLFARHRGGFLTALLLSLLTLTAGIVLLGLSGWFLTAAFLTTAAMSFNLFGPSAAVRGLSLLRILSRYGEKLSGHDATLRVLADIRNWLFRRVGLAAAAPHLALRRGDTVSRLTADVDTLDSIFIVAAGPLATGIVVALGMSAVLLVLLPAAGAVYAVAMTLALLVVPGILSALTRRTGGSIVRLSADLRIAAFDLIDGHADLIAFGATDAMRARSGAIAADLATAREHLARTAAMATSAIALLAGVAIIAVLAFGLAAIEARALSGPLLVGLLLATLGSFEATAAVVRQVAKFGNALAAAERLKALADLPAPVTDPQNPLPLGLGASLVLENVTFGHDAARPVLTSLDLAVEAGSRIAIHGPSGGGKSTLASLLLRLRDPDAGRIRVGGVDLRDVSQAALHRRIALLEQDAPVFIGTIRDNLRIALDDADDAACWAVLAKARLESTVRAMPMGLATPHSEAGLTLSAGQARRLCLARTLLSGAGILVLDEPTSGLDRATELAFLDDLGKATAGRTVILITHATLPSGVVDRVFHLRDGRLDDPCSSIPATA
ncbi:thiol reductant ABC exporter subunit CydC [Rhizobium sp. 9140]|uniref:thiol reductant ABC exporter subunit CydC n=1 Tax=Rhizobium sp. 9140 TaxID=1761900 RepID=UPI0007965170|nr:thiol reductant ABC exporter subunit CydC [Rhizobium sp. 9140]CZT36961.1 ATP-binding cassette, subfamily C, CydC [Rhizobium sp. 9140]